MYTQCPECSAAFRVTAHVLKQAAGKVRCGGCGIAFNALEHLSEEKPASRPPAHPEPDLPELEPDTGDESESRGILRSISAEQSAALLKTLDQLAGEDIRIEDTGVEWRVLGADEEFDGADDTQGIPVAADAADVATSEDMRFDDNTPLPDDFDYQSEPIAPPEPVVESEVGPFDDHSAQVDLVFGDTVGWEELLDEVGVGAKAAAEPDAAEPGPDTGAAADGPDVETESGPRTSPADLDLSGLREALRDDGVEGPDEADDDDEAVGPDHEAESSAAEIQAEGEEAGDRDEMPDDVPVEIPEATADEDATVDILPIDESPTQMEVEFEERERALREQLLAAGGEAAEDAPESEVEDVAEDTTVAEEEPFVPEMTEEEKTINLMIDQDLLAFAVEDQDGFVSTIAPKHPAAAEDATEKEPMPDAAARGAESGLVETIIMEGESVRSALDEMAEENRVAAAASLAALDREVEAEPIPPPRRGMVAAAVGLGLLLGIQIVHQSREALATVPAINSAIAPIYRALGRPFVPAWDINGWRFEATKGSTDDEEQLLTIYSRIGNVATKAMPFPVIHVSLTDRFEEPIGSRIMDPAEYLVAGADPRQMVAPGETFTAVISIESPSPDATGFQLNVCYRLPTTRLRCAIEDFK